MKNKNHQAHDCRFCQYISGIGVTRYIDSPWMENADFAAFISQGAFIDGWTIIVPKKHKINMSSEFSNSSFWNFISEVKEKLEMIYGKTVLFEHGPASFSSIVGCGTDHAHVHLVPTTVDFHKEVLNFSGETTWKKIKTSTIEDTQSEYLFFSQKSQDNFNTGYYAKLKNPTSQFFRKVLAGCLGIPHLYNYKIDPFLEKASDSKALICAKLNQEKV